MDFFQFQDGRLFAEKRAVQQLAEEFGTPLYIYSRATLERHWHAFDSALGTHPHLICYAVKANSNIAVLKVMAQLGCRENWNASWPQVVSLARWYFPAWLNPVKKSCEPWKLGFAALMWNP